jgi:hypothetical protein
MSECKLVTQVFVWGCKQSMAAEAQERSKKGQKPDATDFCAYMGGRLHQADKTSNKTK